MKQFKLNSTLGSILAGTVLALSAGFASAVQPANEPILCTTPNPALVPGVACNAEFQTLYNEIGEAWNADAFTSRNNPGRDCNGMWGKANGAVTYAAKLEFGAAEAKLQDIVDKATTLQATGKLTAPHGELIAGAAYAVQRCLPGGIQ